VSKKTDSRTEEEEAIDGSTARARPRASRSRRPWTAWPRDAEQSPRTIAPLGSDLDLPIISDLLKSGQEILVQIAKEPIAKKGARITSHIALPGRFLVFHAHREPRGREPQDRLRRGAPSLKRILLHERGEASGGLIVRTAAEGASEEELRADLRFLMNLWNDIKQRSESSKSPALIYHDLSLIERILRDQVSSNFSSSGSTPRPTTSASCASSIAFRLRWCGA
jgi:ribonuclease E